MRRSKNTGSQGLEIMAKFLLGTCVMIAVGIMLLSLSGCATGCVTDAECEHVG
jgi:hypothetical protein